MASPKLRPLISSLLRPRRNPISSSSSISILLFSTSAAAAAAAADGPAAAAAEHPWPEWERFLEKLRSKGYFNDRPGPAAAAEASAEMNRAKNACLKFARERFDILGFVSLLKFPFPSRNLCIGSLPKHDIQAVVECGCPNLFPKVVNSAKRLRSLLKLDEGDVCSSCDLRGSCDKAYVIPKEDEGARTVDVVRILMSYAVNAAGPPEGEESIKENVQESVRKLLSEIILLSDTTIDPSLPKPILDPPSQKAPSQRISKQDDQSSGIEMKKGDWLCPSCNFLNFARNLRCLECKKAGPRKEERIIEMKLGDWTCPK
ncbi:Zinc finger protein VAR3, chloroplastic [Ananas comosus]|uniref:Zinc finger protein VAR3, chloroplastic n=1 Tax=Ananas comosus TaxID=4615 RepID=A0A199VB38_ANACO|nr:Zinc finger protein VAR3, chloroplastic [Ananas comosus]